MLNLLAAMPGNPDLGQNPNHWYIGWTDALLYAALGFLVVFVGITILILIVWLMGLIMKKVNGLPKKEKQEEPLKQTPAVTAPVEEEIPDEVKAAIVAAIMAYYESEEQSCKCEFTVKRIKRI